MNGDVGKSASRSTRRAERLPSVTAASVRERRDPRGHRPARQDRAHQPTQAEQPVEAGEHRPPQGGLDGDALGVHRHVERRVGRAEQPERRGDKERARRQQRQRQRQRESAGGQEGDAPASQPADEPSRQRQHDHGADGHRQEHAAERALPEAVGRLDHGNVRHPARQHEPVQEEDRAHRQPGGAPGPTQRALLPALLEELRHQPRPARLVARADAGPVSPWKYS